MPMPGRSYAYSLIWVGLRDEAIAQLEDAVAINPNLKDSYFELAQQYLASDLDEMANCHLRAYPGAGPT